LLIARNNFANAFIYKVEVVGGFVFLEDVLVDQADLVV
jgi:hypothetical protein